MHGQAFLTLATSCRPSRTVFGRCRRESLRSPLLLATQTHTFKAIVTLGVKHRSAFERMCALAAATGPSYRRGLARCTSTIFAPCATAHAQLAIAESQGSRPMSLCDLPCRLAVRRQKEVGRGIVTTRSPGPNPQE